MKTKRKGKKKAKARKIVLGILIAYVAVIAVIYLGASFYYSKHFYSGSRSMELTVPEKPSRK